MCFTDLNRTFAPVKADQTRSTEFVEAWGRRLSGDLTWDDLPQRGSDSAKLCYIAAMLMFQFRIDHPDRAPFEKSRSLEGETEAVAYGRQLLADWPDCAAIDVLQAGELVDRLRPPRP